MTSRKGLFITLTFIGKDYARKNWKKFKDNLFIRVGKIKMGVPRYYRKTLDITEKDYE